MRNETQARVNQYPLPATSRDGRTSEVAYGIPTWDGMSSWWRDTVGIYMRQLAPARGHCRPPGACGSRSHGLYAPTVPCWGTCRADLVPAFGLYRRSLMTRRGAELWWSWPSPGSWAWVGLGVGFIRLLYVVYGVRHLHAILDQAGRGIVMAMAPPWGNGHGRFRSKSEPFVVVGLGVSASTYDPRPRVSKHLFVQEFGDVSAGPEPRTTSCRA